MTAGTTMAKKKPAQRSPKNKERKAPGFRSIGIRVSEDYAAWLERAAKHARVTVATFLDHAAADKAKADGFDEPAPERIP